MISEFVRFFFSEVLVIDNAGNDYVMLSEDDSRNYTTATPAREAQWARNNSASRLFCTENADRRHLLWRCSTLRGIGRKDVSRGSYERLDAPSGSPYNKLSISSWTVFIERSPFHISSSSSFFIASFCCNHIYKHSSRFWSFSVHTKHAILCSTSKHRSGQQARVCILRLCWHIKRTTCNVDGDINIHLFSNNIGFS